MSLNRTGAVFNVLRGDDRNEQMGGISRGDLRDGPAPTSHRTQTRKGKIAIVLGHSSLGKPRHIGYDSH